MIEDKYPPNKPRVSTEIALAARDMLDNPDIDVWVRRQWNDWRTAKVKLRDISEFHFSHVSGGINVRAPRAFLCGYIWCTSVIEGDIAHSCRHGKPPHSIKVVIVKKDNADFKRIERHAKDAMVQAEQKKILKTKPK